MGKNGLTYTRLAGLVIILLVGQAGCRTLRGDKLNEPGYDTVPSLLPYQRRAIEYEQNGQLQQALANWRIAEVLMQDRIEALTEHLENSAEKHYQKGLSFLNAGEVEKARLEFVKTLRYEPGHHDALNHLENSLIPSRTQSYTVEEGDTYASIASKVYQNKGHAFLVSFFSDLDSETDLVPGRKVTLPVLELGFTKRFFNFKRELAQARNDFKEKKYRKVIPEAENILKHKPGNKEAWFMLNGACNGLAEEFVKAGKFDDAIHMLKRVDPMFKDVQARIRDIETLKNKRMAADTESKNEAGYRLGLDLLEKGMYIDALKSFQSVDPAFEDVTVRIEALKEQMKLQAETLYRNGVKFYLNEKLEEAIAEWEKALVLDPSNTKIRKDIDNASQLLKKINEMK